LWGGGWGGWVWGGWGLVGWGGGGGGGEVVSCVFVCVFDHVSVSVIVCDCIVAYPITPLVFG